MENPPIKLRPNLMRPVLLVGGCLLCIGINMWASRVDHTSPLMGTVVLLVVALYFAIELLPSQRGLELSSTGLRVVVPFSAVEVGWRDIAEAGVGVYGRSNVVLLKFTTGASATMSPLTTLTFRRYSMTRVGKAWDGWDAALPDNYGMKAEELADLINRLKQESA
jgi:hypothetical protein